MRSTDYVKFCPICNETKQNIILNLNNEKFQEFTRGYLYLFATKDANVAICPYCEQGKLENSPLTFEEFGIINKISNSDREFLEAMINLKKEDIIEYQSRMSQFRTQVEQQEQIKQAEEQRNQPHCPSCHSTNLKRISGLSKVGSVAFWGIFAAGRTSKTWHCNNCGTEW